MIKPTALRASRSIVDDLALAFDFGPDRASRDHSWIKLIPEQRFDVLAGDSSGGVFLTYGTGDRERLPILYVTSEGQAGTIAPHLTALLGTFVGAPYWQDLLKFSGGGDLGEMRKSGALLRERYEAENLVISAVERLKSALGIHVISDPIKLIHDSVHATDCSVVAEDGSQYEPLFNKFTSQDILKWG